MATDAMREYTARIVAAQWQSAINGTSLHLAVQDKTVAAFLLSSRIIT